MDYFIRAEFLTEARGNPIRLISLLISLFILKRKKKEREKKLFSKSEQSGQRKTTRRRGEEQGRETIESRF